MWSADYYYFEIRSDQNYSQTTNSFELLEYLVNELHFVADGVDGVQGNTQHPWMKLTLVVATTDGSFSSQKSCPEYINLVSVVGSKQTASLEEYSTILNEIAEWLEWKLVENA